MPTAVFAGLRLSAPTFQEEHGGDSAPHLTKVLLSTGLGITLSRALTDAATFFTALRLGTRGQNDFGLCRALDRGVCLAGGGGA